MGAFEYLLLLAAVVLAIAITDLAVSAHKLLVAGPRVRWDALPLLAAVLAFERVVVQWWTWRGASAVADKLTFGMFFAVLVSATLLFLMAAVALPDEPAREEEVVDLRSHYAATSRQFWLLFAAQWTLWNVVSAWVEVTLSKARVDWFSPAYLVLPAVLVLAFVRWRWLHALGLVGFILLYGILFFNRTLS